MEEIAIGIIFRSIFALGAAGEMEKLLEILSKLKITSPQQLQEWLRVLNGLEIPTRLFKYLPLFSKRIEYKR